MAFLYKERIMEYRTQGTHFSISFTPRGKELYETTIGLDREKQLRMVQEEALELALAVARFSRDGRIEDKDHLLEEAADCLNMCIQVACMYGQEDFMKYVNEKLERFEGRVGIVHDETTPINTNDLPPFDSTKPCDSE